MKVIHLLLASMVFLTMLTGCAYIIGINVDRCSQPASTEKNKGKGQVSKTEVPAAESPASTTPPSNPSTEANKILSPLTQ